MLRGLHFLMALSLPLILSALLSCIKAKEEPADLGPQVLDTEIDMALNRAIKGRSIAGTALNQYTTYATTRRFENEETVLNLGDSHVKVTAKKESTASWDFTLEIRQTERLDDGTFDIKNTESTLEVPKNPTVTNLIALTQQMQVRSKDAFAMAEPIRVTYHRLRETNTEIDPPPAVKNRAGCGGLSPCKLPIRYVQYDLVKWYSEAEFRKFAIDLGFSLSTPYLPFGPRTSTDQYNGLLVVNCAGTQVTIPDRTVFLRDCVSIEDFQK